MESMGKLYDRVAHVEQDVHELRDNVKEWKKEIIHEFKIIAEDLRHDLIGIHKDKLENHEDRITRIEEHVGLAAA